MQGEELKATATVTAKDLTTNHWMHWGGSWHHWERILEVEMKGDKVHLLLQFGDGPVIKSDAIVPVRYPMRTIHVFSDGEVELG